MQRNALEAAYTAAVTFENLIGENVPAALNDASQDIRSLLDTWSKRNPLRVTEGERSMMRAIIWMAWAIIPLGHDAVLSLSEAEHLFNAALAGERLLASAQPAAIATDGLVF